MTAVGQVVDEFAAARGLEVEHADDPAAPKQHVVGKQVAVDHAGGQPFLQIFFVVRDFVVQHVQQMFQMSIDSRAQVLIEALDTLETETVVDGRGEFLAGDVELRQHGADLLDVVFRKRGSREALARQVVVERYGFAPVVAEMLAVLIGHRPGTGDAVFAQEDQQVDFALRFGMGPSPRRYARTYLPLAASM